MGVIKEVDEDHFEEQINENIPDEIINDPEKERSKFLAFMQKTVNTHPAQQQVLDFLNDRNFRNKQSQKKKKNEPDDIIINSRKRKRKINRNNY